jgi:hypothetical protein
VTFCAQLDKHLVMGSYDQVCVVLSGNRFLQLNRLDFVEMQVLASAAHPPTKYYTFFLTSLLETVRINIGECAAAAYTQLSIAAATQLLMFDNREVRCDVNHHAMFTYQALTLCGMTVAGDARVHRCVLPDVGGGRGPRAGAHQRGGGQGAALGGAPLAEAHPSEPGVRHGAGAHRVNALWCGLT